MSIPKKSATTLRLLHTSDWHIGKRLFGQSRYDEFEQFLNWLHNEIVRHEVDVLIVAGDVFDTATPSNKAQELYYEFLGKIATSPCRHVIITAGNHDSPTFLDAPKIILKSLNVHVVGQACTNPKDEVLLLLDDRQNAQAIVLAVPYLRDRDVRTGGSFEAISQRDEETARGIAAHYQSLVNHAKTIQDTLPNTVPIIATGHLFAAGANISSYDDGMRQEVFVGTLGQISASIFDECLDYVALGHIHAPQKVAGQERIHYCGSPIAMGFGEIGKRKQVLVVDFDSNKNNTPIIHSLFVPVFTKLVHLEGDMNSIKHALQLLIDEDKTIYAEVIYTGVELAPNFTQEIRAFLINTKVLPLNIQNTAQRQHVLRSTHQGENLKNLSQIDVFNRLLERRGVDSNEKEMLRNAYQSVILSIHEQDTMST